MGQEVRGGTPGPQPGSRRPLKIISRRAEPANFVTERFGYAVERVRAGVAQWQSLSLPN